MVGQVDTVLVEAARSGRQEALDELIAQYLPLVYNIVGRALARHADVDDVVQDTMLRVVRGLPGLRDPHRFRSWLVAITVNRVRDHHRSRRSDPAPLDEVAEPADPGADFVDLTLTELGLSGQRREVAQATRWLDPEDRDLLSLWWLVTAGHLTRAELVGALDLDPHHVTVRVARMKGRLEGARLVVRALAAVPGCAGLADAAASWRGDPAPLWRKRFARHIRECGYCPSDLSDLIPAERLLAGLALIPPPVGYAAYMLSAVHGPSAVHGVAQPAPTEQLRIPRQRNGSGSHRLSSHRVSLHGGSLLGKPLLGIAAVITAVGAGLGVAYKVLPGSPTAAPLRSSPAFSPRAMNAPISASASASASPSAPASPSASPSPSAKPSSAAPQTSKAAPPKSTAAGTSAADSTVSQSAVSQSAVQQVLALINQARAGAGLPAYTITAGLTSSATAHTQTMEGGCGLSHQCPGEPALGARETAAGVQWTSAGENIGDGGPVSNTDAAIAQMAVGLTQDMLDEKPPNDGHRQNILSGSFHHIGISVSRDAQGTVWMTQDFSN